MKITIIGAGNMGGAIARALAVFMPAGDITVTARTSETLQKYAGVGFNVTTDNAAAVEDADMIIFAVKPWLMEEVVSQVAGAIDCSTQVVASVAAGISFRQMAGWIGGVPAMFRIIPNTAIEIGSGVTFVSAHNASAEQKLVVLDMFGRMGYALEVEEEMMAAGTALASCGIAYAMKYIKASAEGGQALGFDAEQARRIVEYTVKGAAELLLATGNAPQTEIDKVTTPGGMTMKGLAAMDEAGFDTAVHNGLDACLK